jgi:hypothetical protein
MPVTCRRIPVVGAHWPAPALLLVVVIGGWVVDVLVGVGRFRVWPRPTRAPGWALTLIGGSVAFANLVHEFGPRVFCVPAYIGSCCSSVAL